MVSQFEDTGYRVLLVDDDESFLELTSIYLNDEELSIDTVSDPRKALDVFSGYDCLVSDYQMPGIDGLELLKEVREEIGSDIPFIMFTGKGREEVAMDALNLGADRYLQKGGDPKTQFMELKHAIKEAIDKKQTEKKLKKEEKRAEKYFETARVLMVAIDENGVILDANKKASELLKTDKDDLIGDNWFNYIGDREKQTALEIHNRVLDGEKDLSIEIPLVVDNGVEKVVSWRISPLKNDENSIIGSFGSGIDVTERLEREREIEEKTRMLEGMLDGVQDIIGFQLPDHTIIRYNQKGYEALGISPEEVKGKKCYELLGREGPCRICPTNQAIEEKEITKIDKYQPEFDKYLSVTANPVLNEDNEVEFIIEHLRDVTDRVEYEEKIKKLSKEYETVFNNVETSIFLVEVKNNEFRFKRLNPYEEQLIGKKTTEVKGKTPTDVFGEKIGEKLEERYRECLETKNTITYEERVELPDRDVYAVTKLTPIIKEGSVDLILGTSHDVTEMKNKEIELEKTLSRLKTLMEEQEVGILFENMDREIIYANKELCRIFNIPKKSLLIGEDCQKIAEKAKNQFNDPNKFIEGIEKLIENNKKRKGEEITLKDGRILLRDYIPIKEEGKNIKNGHLWQYKDITKLKEMEKREEFLYSLLRHDVKNKNQVAKGYLQLIEKEKIPTENKKHLEKAIKSIEESSEIIEKVKTIIELENTSEKQEIELEKLLNEVIREIKNQAERKDIEIKKKTQGCKVEGGSLLKQAIYNIIENSIRHSECQKIKITTEKREDGCTITIEDDGEGIAEEKRNKIFNQGYSKGEGTGLGLYITKKIIENHDGSIKCKKSDLGGVQFKIKLKKHN
ncbi:PAS domain-containing protein [Methanonatronarchaeum sp. AMET-Sl]|uniref:hybrid sensor histidine kinase/response regulator n=1 Tax=Methanonatronarchaeum sp. AMET-Sl TaxID=3037654 RepID=UPI00244DE287|nr:PAS domain-containing protein [Methanonatronarchaeum sp. AMET-Sl]WGI18075.1 PAS domain-containing protein [Methanonatronarchaeum sp. AMET-Sl]